MSTLNTSLQLFTVVYKSVGPELNCSKLEHLEKTNHRGIFFYFAFLRPDSIHHPFTKKLYQNSFVKKPYKLWREYLNTIFNEVCNAIQMGFKTTPYTTTINWIIGVSLKVNLSLLWPHWQASSWPTNLVQDLVGNVRIKSFCIASRTMNTNVHSQNSSKLGVSLNWKCLGLLASRIFVVTCVTRNTVMIWSMGFVSQNWKCLVISNVTSLSGNTSVII